MQQKIFGKKHEKVYLASSPKCCCTYLGIDMKEYIVNPVAIRLDSSDRGSIYEAITAMGLRARQINDDVKAQLQSRMQHIDPLEDETEYGNYDQMQISKEFDKIPKPTFIAMREMYERKLFYRVESPMPPPPMD
jgi:DNA-directed RNA polymerase subunit K/omega